MSIPVPKSLPSFNSESIGADADSSAGQHSLPAGARSLIDELEAATHEASQERRVQMLRRVTDLFVGSAGALGADQADVFGDVLGHLIQRIENEVLAELGGEVLQLLENWRGASFADENRQTGFGEPGKGAAHGNEDTCFAAHA
jgi:hypothetical protein